MKRSKFSLSNYKLASFDMGELVPCGLLEVLPGDTIQMASSILLRCSPLVTPVMHQVDLKIHHWYVPHRLVWEEWEDFITGGPDGMDTSVFPTITFATAAEVGSLADYLGVVPGVDGIEVSALPFRAYAKIWNEFYRDQDLQAELPLSEASGDDTTTSTLLQNVGWEKDYFTSSRPWEQKGPAITIPLGTSAPILGLGTAGTGATTPNQAVRETVGDRTYAFGQPTNQVGSLWGEFTSADTATYRPNIRADLSNASAITVNRLREALALQRYEEMRARYGSRYTEYLRALGVRSSDGRLQRPEYLGGGRQPVQFSEVLTTFRNEEIPTGEMAGHGIAAMRSNRYRRFFEEHGYIISCIHVKPRTMYAQGLARTLNRRVKEDFWQRELQFIGQQEVQNKEVYAAHATPEGVFGYQDRYDEYRRQENTIAGEFRTVLDNWHMARIFTSDPALNASFVNCVPTDRNFAVPSNDVMLAMVRHSVQARRMVAAVGRSMTF